MNSAETWRLGHRPALTGLRTIAVLMVLLTHVGVPHTREFGAVGVTMFFTLSGFLITALLLEERQEAGRFSIPAFYLRRAFRLIPALVACTIVAVVAEWIVEGRIADWSLVGGALTWTSNFVMADAGWNGWAVTPLSHTWSLAVEEQFYLLWPLVLLVLSRLPKLWMIAGLAYLALGSVFIESRVGFEHGYLMLDGRANQLVLGGMLAVALVGSRTHRIDSRWAALGIAAVVLLAIVSNGRPGIAVIVAVLTVGVLYVGSQVEIPWLSTGPMVWIGDRAYGIYLYHRPIGFVAVAVTPGIWWLSGGVTIAVTLIAAWASYHWIESPVRLWGRARSRNAGDVTRQWSAGRTRPTLRRNRDVEPTRAVRDAVPPVQVES